MHFLYEINVFDHFNHLKVYEKFKKDMYLNTSTSIFNIFPG